MNKIITIDKLEQLVKNNDIKTIQNLKVDDATINVIFEENVLTDGTSSIGDIFNFIKLSEKQLNEYISKLNCSQMLRIIKTQNIDLNYLKQIIASAQDSNEINKYILSYVINKHVNYNDIFLIENIKSLLNIYDLIEKQNCSLHLQKFDITDIKHLFKNYNYDSFDKIIEKYHDLIDWKNISQHQRIGVTLFDEFKNKYQNYL